MSKLLLPGSVGGRKGKQKTCKKLEGKAGECNFGGEWDRLGAL